MLIRSILVLLSVVLFSTISNAKVSLPDTKKITPEQVAKFENMRGVKVTKSVKETVAERVVLGSGGCVKQDTSSTFDNYLVSSLVCQKTTSQTTVKINPKGFFNAKTYILDVPADSRFGTKMITETFSSEIGTGSGDDIEKILRQQEILRLCRSTQELTQKARSFSEEEKDMIANCFGL